ncbi:MAG: polysaccharide deacetylase family protein [Desulfobacterales bacterium]|nr:MAG: polysaccharide deacetylase family protein [Desulfobacterales bacterium]
MRVDNILTVDVEDWFHICGIEDMIPADRWSRLESRVSDNTLKILMVLQKKRIKATFFVLGSVAEKHPSLVKAIQRHGHEIATHGYSHQRVYTMSPEAFRKDLRKSVSIISEITGCGING